MLQSLLLELGENNTNTAEKIFHCPVLFFFLLIQTNATQALKLVAYQQIS